MKFKQYLEDIKHGRDLFNYLQRLHEEVTYDTDLSTDESLHLQRMIELELYIFEKDLKTDFNNSIGIILHQ